MKNLEMKTDRITNYLYDFDPQQKWDFEADLKTDKELLQEFLLHKEIDQSIKNELKVKNFRDTLEQIHQDQYSPRSNKIFNLQNKWYWAAASITVFSGTAVYTLNKPSQSANRLYNKYYEVWQPGFITRGQTSNSNLSAVTLQFEQGDYSQALALIEQLDNQSSLNPQMQLIQGCSFMELGMFNDAISVFKLFDNQDYTLYTEAAQWYKALCYLKNNNTSEAQATLQIIADSMGTYSEDAQTILKKMK